MRIALTALALAGLLAGCDHPIKTHELQKTVKGLMNDPASAQFRNITWSGADACGEVNARNRMGGYVGFTPFVFDGGLQMVEIFGGDPREKYRALSGYGATIDTTQDWREIVTTCEVVERWGKFCPGQANAAVTSSAGFCKALKTKGSTTADWDAAARAD